LLTGQWMSRHGNRAFEAFKTPWKETYPGILRDRGYYVGHIGKWHNGSFPQAAFDVGKSYAGTHWMKQADGSKVHVTEKNETDAIEFLRSRPADKPFCLTLAFFATHAEDGHPDQYLPQPDSLELYKDTTIPVPPTAGDDSFKRLPPFIANEKNEGRNRWHWRFDAPDKYQTYMKNYYRLATEVDAVCGRVIAELKQQGVYDKKLVIFTTDNGYFHGEHGLADKWYPYQESIRVPLIVHDPRLPSSRAGQTIDAMTLNVDLAPTILGAAQATRPQGMQGQDMAPLYLAATPPTWRTEFFYEHAVIKDVDFIPASEALVQKDWKYIYWPDFKVEQLFDLKNDPLEEHDLVKDRQQAQQLEKLRARFAELKNAAR
jgi:arylsulfatase A-like enzyme